jgi:hypothetical protein
MLRFYFSKLILNTNKIAKNNYKIPIMDILYLGRKHEEDLMQYLNHFKIVEKKIQNIAST